MPIAKYNRHFGGNAAGALRSMVKRYGAKKGRQVFYATINKRRAQATTSRRGRR